MKGIAMDERTMFELLEIFDAKKELQEDQKLISEIRKMRGTITTGGQSSLTARSKKEPPKTR